MKHQIVSNIIIAVFVLAIALMLLVPLPMALLDILLAINISFALLLLLVGLYMPNALALLAFPGILLLTTLFRLGLNVASTRLILSQGEAGKIIDAFGGFLIQGEIVVGVIIFIIITVVNFIVIARGAGRVSEVAARFALDALPGKQMAIDADLRAGVINALQAEKLRDDLRKESQLYGSMDGAMKFVQGDAVAGLFIIFTNILGGMYLGIQNGLSFADAVQTYTTLTVGDGLVSQIPALLISICAGIVVTRVSSGQNSTLGSDIGNQLFDNPILLSLTAIIILSIAILPGVPALPFVSVALILFALAYVMKKWKIPPLPQSSLKSSSESLSYITTLPALSGSESNKFLPVTERRFVLQLGLQLFASYEQKSEYYLVAWRQMQERISDLTGLQLGDLAIVLNRSLGSSVYQFDIAGAQAFSAETRLGAIFAETSTSNAQVLGLEIISRSTHPLHAMVNIWIPASNDQKKIAEAAGIALFDAIEFAYLNILNCLLRSPEELLSMSDIQNIVRQLDKTNPGLSEQVLFSNYINITRLTEILQQLVREGVPVKDSRQILEAIASYCSTFRSSMVNNDDFDLHDIVSFIRLRLKRALMIGIKGSRNSLRVITLASDTVELFENTRYDSTSNRLVISSEVIVGLQAGLQNIIDVISQRGLLPIVVVCKSELRHKVQSFLIDHSQALRVIGLNELTSDTQRELAGIWALNT